MREIITQTVIKSLVDRLMSNFSLVHFLRQNLHWLLESVLFLPLFDVFFKIYIYLFERVRAKEKRDLAAFGSLPKSLPQHWLLSRCPVWVAGTQGHHMTLPRKLYQKPEKHPYTKQLLISFLFLQFCFAGYFIPMESSITGLL